MMIGALPFKSPWLLAPMEGVTTPSFRRIVLDMHRPENLGGAFTEFLRVIDHPVPRKVIRRHMGPDCPSSGVPVGLQFMANNLDTLEGSVETAVEEGNPLIDLNFGCPAKGPVGGCVGSALLRTPDKLQSLIARAVKAANGRVPVTAKIRAGFDDASNVEEIARRVEAGGASLLTIHCRTRLERYQPEVDWSRIRRAVEAISIPVCGNGGVESFEDRHRMREETGCHFVMIGRAVLVDPWIFSGKKAGAKEAWDFLVRYADSVRAYGAPDKVVVKCMKQIMRVFDVGGILKDPEIRLSWIREREIDDFLDRLEAHREGGPRERVAGGNGVGNA